jgi:NAD(P)-dependent dehydrogenase (short-subunit alcohol dehydrogenase family)
VHASACVHRRARTDSAAPSRPSQVERIGRRIVEATNQPNAIIRYVETDLGVLASIRKAASDVQGMNIMLKLLVNAAGVCAPAEHLKSNDSVDLAFAVNFVGPVLLMQLLHPLLRKVFVHVCARGCTYANTGVRANMHARAHARAVCASMIRVIVFVRGCAATSCLAQQTQRRFLTHAHARHTRSRSRAHTHTYQRMHRRQS